MTHKRNTDGLAKAANKRRLETIERAKNAIDLLIKQGKSINFNSVAVTAQIGKTWLYKEIEIRDRIFQLRKNVVKKIRASVNSSNEALSSENSLIKMLKYRVRELETENQALKKQIEIIYGELHLAMQSHVE